MAPKASSSRRQQDTEAPKASTSRRQQEIDDVDAAEDWASIAPRGLDALERSLRCDICSEIFEQPVAVVGCGHVFCSSCVRDAIARSTDSVCPAPSCSIKGISGSKLQSVRAIADAVLAWRNVRSELMSTLRRAGKRKADGQGNTSSSKRRKTGKESSDNVDLSEDDDIVEVDRDPQLFPNSIIECPSCHRKMKFAELDSHLNRCGKEAKQNLGALGKLGKPPKAPKEHKRIAENDVKVSEILEKLEKVYGLRLDADKETVAYIRAYWARWKAIFNGNLDAPPEQRASDSELREKMRSSVKAIRAELAGTGPSKAAIKSDHAKTNAAHFKELIRSGKDRNKAAPMSRSTSAVTAPTDAIDDIFDPVDNSPPRAAEAAPAMDVDTPDDDPLLPPDIDDDQFDVLAPLPSPKAPLLKLPPPEPFKPDFPRASQRSPPRRW